MDLARESNKSFYRTMNITQKFLLQFAYIGVVQCLDFQTFFGMFIGLGKSSSSRLSASHCVREDSGERCRFNSNALNLNLFGSIKLSVKENGRQIVCNRRKTSRKQNWYGYCDGDAQDINFVSRKDTDGRERVYGSIRVGNEVCHISPGSSGNDEIDCRPDSDFLDDHHPVQAPRELLEEAQNNNTSVFGYSQLDAHTSGSDSLRGGSRHDNQRYLFDDSGASIDIMVVWTQEAECGNSKLTKFCTLTPITDSNMRGLIQLAVAETNTAFELSGINTQIRLVHAYRDPDYIEQNSTTSQYIALDNLSSKVDGVMDDVHEKRTLYGADMVHMIVASPFGCGLAYTGTPSSSCMFSLSSFMCTTGYFSFGHELAHNMNSRHDRGTENDCKTSSNYNFGYRDPDAAFRTILSFDCTVDQCDNIAKKGCPRVQRFSNPNNLYNGKAIGSITQDNTRQMNNVRSVVASFFPAMNCKSDSECNDQDSMTVDSCDIKNAICVFTAGAPPPSAAPSTPKQSPIALPITAPMGVPTVTLVPSAAQVPVVAPSASPVKEISGSTTKPSGTLFSRLKAFFRSLFRQ